MDPNRNKRIEGLWKLGFSQGKIADLEGMTRNAVAGICHRAGLRRENKPTVVRIERTKMMMREEEGLQPIRRGIPIGELQEHHCRWIVGAGELDLATYCGSQKTPGSSYCLTHYRMAHYNPR